MYFFLSPRYFIPCKSIFWQKKRRKPRLYGLSPLRWYKDNTISAEIQIALTFRNTRANVKMQRFAAARIWRVLYYEGRIGELGVVCDENDLRSY